VSAIEPLMDQNIRSQPIAGITVRWNRQWWGRFLTTLNVVIDGTNVGGLKQEQEIAVGIDPGAHTLSVTYWAGSLCPPATLPFAVREFEHKRFECGGKHSVLRGDYLWITEHATEIDTEAVTGIVQEILRRRVQKQAGLLATQIGHLSQLDRDMLAIDEIVDMIVSLYTPTVLTVLEQEGHLFDVIFDDVRPIFGLDRTRKICHATKRSI
jgi:hypothetical protein